MTKPSWKSKPLALAAAAGLLFAACGSGNSPATSTGPGGSAPAASSASLAGQKVTVIGTWTGNEQDAFMKMVQPWEAQTGATVSYTGTRDINTVLSTGVQSGVLPDLAGLPGPGQMAEYAQAGALQDLSTVLDVNTYKSETAAPLVDLGTVNGKIVGVFIKTAVKGLIWYDPKVITVSTPPATWNDLQTLISQNSSKATAPWCLGVESGAASGWPGTDWIEDIILRQQGPDYYNSWWQGKTKWTDPGIKQAWQTFGQVVNSSYGGATGVNATNFANAGDPLFKNPPGCLFLHQASFITGLGAFKTATAGTDYNFFPFPDINSQYTGAIEGAGDLFGEFHNTPAANSLIAYLVTAQAQDIWVKIGGALSANKNATDYPDDISKRSAAMLLNAKIFVFDASDNMPAAMNAAFWSSIVAYVKDTSDTNLDKQLANLDTVQSSAYGS